MGGTEHLKRGSSRSLIFHVLRSREAFKLKFSCLTSLKSLFSPVMTDFRLFECSTLNWSKSRRTPALHSVQMKVSEQHTSVEWSDESDVVATAAAETPSTEVLAASATEGESVVMETAALSLLTGVLSQRERESGGGGGGGEPSQLRIMKCQIFPKLSVC